MRKEILVICPKETDWGLVSKAADLAGECGRKVHALALFSKRADEGFLYGADRVDILELTEDFADDFLFASFLKEKIQKEWHAETILAPATIRLRAIMPILAGLLDAGLTADCTALELREDGRLLQFRPAFGNSLTAWIITAEGAEMATVRPGIFCEKRCEKPGETIRTYRLTGTQAVRQLHFDELKESCSLVQAEIILAGGMGIGSKENFLFLSEAAKKIGAAVGASRMAVDAGYAPYACQIGQTGVTVHPRLYIAVGISGAVQHLAGMSGAETVIAVNSDSRAPIFDYADYGIVGDWKKTISLLMSKL